MTAVTAVTAATPRALWDISPAIHAAAPVFPGDTPYTQQWCATIGPGCPVNVSAIHLSPHVGAHADAPLHYDRRAPPPARSIWRHFWAPAA